MQHDMRIQFIQNKGIQVGEKEIMLGSDIGEQRAVVFNHADLFKEENTFILSYFENLSGNLLRYECGAWLVNQFCEY